VRRRYSAFLERPLGVLEEFDRDGCETAATGKRCVALVHNVIREVGVVLPIRASLDSRASRGPRWADRGVVRASSGEFSSDVLDEIELVFAVEVGEHFARESRTAPS